MRKLITNIVARFVPPHFHNPFALAMRLIRARQPAARFSVITVFLGVILTPIDLLLHLLERRLYTRAGKPKLPLIFVCGAPRTGTTLVAQVLIKHLPVTYMSNLTAIFPRSPIIANLIAQKFIGKRGISYESFYGKTSNWAGPNDGFYVWNRWMTADSSGVHCVLIKSKQDAMVRFFGAHEHVFKRPLLNKNNSLNMCADSLAAVLENAYFICMGRDPSYLAQSLIQARIDLQGNPATSLWADRPDKAKTNDYVEDVCEQVLFHEEKMREQQTAIGSERFWIIEYEEFCRAPAELVTKVAERILNQPVDAGALRSNLLPFKTTNRIKLPPEIFKKIEESFARLRKSPSNRSKEASAVGLTAGTAAAMDRCSSPRVPVSPGR